MGLFDRIGRLVRANLNDTLTQAELGYGLTLTGAAMGASVGKAGILAGGTGYSVGTLPLAGAGALTGLALYEVITIVLEKDSSSLGAAGIGAVAGAGVSAAIGGVGVSAGGTAIGAGMVSMAAAGAVAGLGIAGLSRLLWQQDIEKLLDQAIFDMQEDLVKFRQAVVNVIASQKRYQQQYNQNQSQANQWYSRAQLAMQKGDENLAREALKRRKSYLETANTIKQTLDQQTAQVETLKRKLTIFESKVTEAKAKQYTLKARIQAFNANQQLQGMIRGINPNGATAAFERMEEKVLQMEARSKAAGELVGADLESQFAALEAGSDVDDELAAMKAQLSGAGPKSSQTNDTPKSDVDAELDELRQQLDKM
jgi:phage shock protein A